MSGGLFDLDDLAAPASVPPVGEPRRTKVREHERRVSVKPRASVPRSRRTDPDTSAEAARVAQVNADTHKALALAALAAAGAKGLNDFELADRTGVPQTSIGVRRKALVTAGLVERAPIHPRPSPSGSPSIVWRCTDEGYQRAKALAPLGGTP